MTTTNDQRRRRWARCGDETTDPPSTPHLYLRIVSLLILGASTTAMTPQLSAAAAFVCVPSTPLAPTSRTPTLHRAQHHHTMGPVRWGHHDLVSSSRRHPSRDASAVDRFSTAAAFTYSTTSTRLAMAAGNPALLRRSVTLPLLDAVPPADAASRYVVPLPSSHLPNELTTPHLYGLDVESAAHRMMFENAVARGGEVRGEVGGREGWYGHVVAKGDGGGGGEGRSDLVGAVGCAAEVLVCAPSGAAAAAAATSPSAAEEKGPVIVLARGSFRFKVREVVKTFPFPVAVVDELPDGDEDAESSPSSADEKGTEEDDDDFYDEIPVDELVSRTLQTLRVRLEQKLDETSKPLSPLEKSILEEASGGMLAGAPSAARSQSEEALSVLDVFVSSLVDVAPTPIERRYAVAMLAAELGGFENDDRRSMLIETDGTRRLRRALRILDEVVGMERARKMVTGITEEKDEANKDLKIGTPELPPWSSRIKQGTRIEYFWNEQEGWCTGTVSEDPVKVIDELIVTVRFDDDGSTHRLPFRPEEKVRWRPE